MTIISNSTTRDIQQISDQELLLKRKMNGTDRTSLKRKKIEEDNVVRRGEVWQRSREGDHDYTTQALSERGNRQIVMDEIVYQLDLVQTSTISSVQCSAAASLLQTLLQYQKQHSATQRQIQAISTHQPSSYLIASADIVKKLTSILEPSCCNNWSLFQTILCVALVFLSNYIATTRAAAVSSEVGSDDDQAEKLPSEESRGKAAQRGTVDHAILSFDLLQRIVHLDQHLGYFSKSASFSSPSPTVLSQGNTPIKESFSQLVSSSSVGHNSRPKRKFSSLVGDGKLASPLSDSPLRSVLGYVLSCDSPQKNTDPVHANSTNRLSAMWSDFYHSLFMSSVSANQALTLEQESTELTVIFYNCYLQLALEDITIIESTNASDNDPHASLKIKLKSIQDLLFTVSSESTMTSKRSDGKQEASTLFEEVSLNALTNSTALSNQLQRNRNADLSHCKYQLFSLIRTLEFLENVSYDNASAQIKIAVYVAAGRSNQLSFLSGMYYLLQTISPHVFLYLRDIVTKKVVNDPPNTNIIPHLDLTITRLLPINPSEAFSKQLLFELFLQLLKFFVTATNNCESGIDQILSESNSLDWLFALLFLCCTWKSELKLRQSKTDSHSSEVERQILQAILSITSLLCNIIEIVNDQYSMTEHYFIEELRNWMKSYQLSNVLELFPSLENSLPLEEYPWSNKPVVSGVGNLCSQDARKLPLFSFLLSLILSETEAFLQDLMVYELQQNKSSSETATRRRSDKLSSPILVSHAKERKDEADSERVPVSEILTSSHLIMLIHTLVFGRIKKEQFARSTGNKTNILPRNVRNELLPVLTALPYYLCNQLPRKNFWLFIRVLKAQIALQEQCGVGSYDSYFPSLMVIAHLEYQNQMLNSELLAEYSNYQEEGILIQHFKTLRAQKSDDDANIKAHSKQELRERKEDKETRKEELNELSSLDWLFEDKRQLPQLRRSFSGKSSSSTSRESSQSNYDFAIKYERSQDPISSVASSVILPSASHQPSEFPASSTRSVHSPIRGALPPKGSTASQVSSPFLSKSKRKFSGKQLVSSWADLE